MMERLEYKFLLNNKKIDSLRQALMPFLFYDVYAERSADKQYTVRSIYFDTSRLRYYHEKIDGIKIRKKIRIRGYDTLNGQDLVFLEIKRKYENYISKNRAGIRYIHLPELFQTGKTGELIVPKPDPETAKEDARRFLHHVFKNNLRPTVLVAYDREAYFSKFNSGLRITIDKNLRYLAFPALSDLFEDEKLQFAQKGFSTLEIKFHHGYPDWLREILKQFHLSRQALSKYTICLDAQRSLHAIKRRSTIAFTDQFWHSESY
ncbi:MAG: polyphosphate polymerase domain-containing protein [Calditrichaceae bacterium]|nr:polyphosphate polymerase domain-containing protein [Calditrichaceae bacterium]MBN2707769.1 polyphosphate polymerase domain-containing protein [Calditrichaceae bacterium]RQV96403.1 MAG: polyphosphate polymerase domain-containing protein [Calditrichota bacterium]